MLKNYIKIALRNLLRHKLYTTINVLGLSLGIASALILYVYIKNELSYDNYHSKADRIYRITGKYLIEGEEEARRFSGTSYLAAPTLLAEYPEVENVVRVFQGTDKKPITYKDKKVFINDILYVDSTYFSIFDQQFIKGNPKTALKNPNSIVLTRTAAEKIFGSVEEAYNKTLLMFDYQNNKVTGIIEDLPENSHFRYSALVSMTTIYNEATKDENRNLDNWLNFNYPTYVLLKKGTDVKIFEKHLNEMGKNYIQPRAKSVGFEVKGKLFAQALKDIHLSKVDYLDDIAERSKIEYVYIFSAIALFLLLIASINYMNLATARSANRAKEVGIRKVVGSYKVQLMSQFLVESVILVGISLVMGLFLLEVLMPIFNQVVDKKLGVQYFQDPIVWLIIVSILFGVGLFSGIYPAFFLSSFNPIMVLKGRFLHSPRNAALRKILVVFQFSISIVMIICTWIVYQQLNYVSNKNLGFDKEHVLMIRNFNDEIYEKVEVIKRALEQNPNISAVATSNFRLASSEAQNTEGLHAEKENGELVEGLYNMLNIDYDYLEMIGVTLIQGRNFSKEFPSDTSKAIIVNEAYVKQLGLRNPIGKKIVYGMATDSTEEQNAKIVGVVKNFHTGSLHNAIRPCIFTLTRKGGTFYIKMTGKNIPETLEFIQKTWLKFDTKYPYEAFFLDQNFAKTYRADQQRGQIFLAFSGLTILIACLGLLGLASFMVEQKTKEIGIRKVLGASVPNILFLISRDFIILIVIANVIAAPFAYYFMSGWLESFAYRIHMNPIAFIIAGVIALFIALVTISFQALRATSVNPVEVLKDE